MNSLDFQPFQFDPNEFSNTPSNPGVNGFRSARYDNSSHVQLDYDQFSHSAPSSRDLHYSSVGIESLSPLTDSIIEKNDRLFMKPSSPIGEPTILKHAQNRQNFSKQGTSPSQINQFQHQSPNHYLFSLSPSNTTSHLAISPPSHHTNSLSPTSSSSSLFSSQFGGLESSLFSPPPHMMGFGPSSSAIFSPIFSSSPKDEIEDPFAPNCPRESSNSGGQSQFSNLDSDLDEFMKTCGVDLEISKPPTGSDSISSGQSPSGNSDVLFSLHGEHPLGEHPSRTLFVRNINSNVEDEELRTLFESFGTIRSMYTQCKHRGFVMISYFDIRHAKIAMRHLQGRIIRRRKIDIHYSIPKFNPSEKDQNQGTLVVFNLDSSITNEELKSIFGNYGEIKEIRETPNKKHHKFIEFYDVRDAEKAMKQLNKTEIKSKKIKIEPSRPGGARKVLMRQLAYELMDPDSPSISLPSDGRLNFESSSSFQFGKMRDQENDELLSSASCPATPLSTSPSSERFFDKFVGLSRQSHSPPHQRFSSNEPRTFSPNLLGQGQGQGSASLNRQLPGQHVFSLSAGEPLSDRRSVSPIGSRNLTASNSLDSFSAVRSQSPSPTSSRAHSPISGRLEKFLSSSSGSPVSPNNNSMKSGSLQEGVPLSLPSRNPPRGLRPETLPIITTSPPPSTNNAANMQLNGNSPHNTHHSNNNSPNNNSNNNNNNNAKSDQTVGSSGSSSGSTPSSTTSPSEEKALYLIDLVKVTEGADVRTTLMIKNIPNKYSQKMLLAAVDEKHKGLYDFFYLPIDFKNKCNVGYAFINFISPLSITSFFTAFNNSKWEKFNSEKVCAITYARIQGKNSLISHFQNSSLMCEDRKCRPIIFHSEGPNQGELEPFPVGPNVRPRRGGAT